MKCILMIFLLISPTFAQKSLGRDQFLVSVRPILTAIINDFYQMISHLPEFPKSMTTLIQEINTINSDKELLKLECPKIITLKCKAPLNSLKEKLLKIRMSSLRLLSDNKMSSSIHINTLAGLRILQEFDLELEEVKGHIDNSSFLLAAGIPQKKETFFIIKELDELSTLISLSVIEFTPYFYKEDFRHFFFNFIRPLQQQISKSTGHEFLNQNINSLNFAINLINQTLTKKKKTPEGMGPYLSVIHNRWNSILRYYF